MDFLLKSVITYVLPMISCSQENPLPQAQGPACSSKMETKAIEFLIFSWIYIVKAKYH